MTVLRMDTLVLGLVEKVARAARAICSKRTYSEHLLDHPSWTAFDLFTFTVLTATSIDLFTGGLLCPR